MKRILVIVMILMCRHLQAQVSFDMRAGYSVNTVDVVVAAGMQFSAHNLFLHPEMMVYTRDDAPVCFGLKIGYSHPFSGDWWIAGGYGRYFDLFSTNKGNTNRNGWSNMLFANVGWTKWFAEYDYRKGNVITIGVKEPIF